MSDSDDIPGGNKRKRGKKNKNQMVEEPIVQVAPTNDDDSDEDAIFGKKKIKKVKA